MTSTSRRHCTHAETFLAAKAMNYSLSQFHIRQPFGGHESRAVHGDLCSTLPACLISKHNMQRTGL